MDQPSRRAVLQLGFFGGLAALLLGLPPGGRRARAQGAVSSDAPQALLDAVAQGLFHVDPADAAAGSPRLPDPAAVDTGRHAWAFVLTMPRATRWQLHGLLRSLEHGSRIRTGTAFSRLPVAQRQALLATMATSRFRLPRLAVQGLKQVCAMGYFRHGQVWAAIGYDGPTLLRQPPGAPGDPP